jgi:hypothetical protein
MVKNMKAPIQLIAIAIVALTTLTQASRAGLVTGSIGFGGLVGFDTSSALTATMVTGWTGTTEITATGSFATYVTQSAPVSVNDAPWHFNTGAPFASFWTVGGFNFELISSTIVSQGGTPGVNGFVVVSGRGVISGNGFTPTTCNWSFSSQDPPAFMGPGSEWTFSAAFTATGSNGAPRIVSAIITNNLVAISWNDPTFRLQAAPAFAGPYTNVPSAKSPYTIILTGTQRFFRLEQ